MSTIKISIVLGSYNQCDKLKRVMDAFNHQTMPASDYELIVVDSGSTDGTHELFKATSLKCHYHFIVQENKGKTGARNRGVNEASGKYIIITDADMIPDQAFVETHYKAQKSSPKPSCFEGMTYNMDTYHWPPQPQKTSPYITRNYGNHHRLGWYYFLTGNISFPKSLFEEIGGFDTDFMNYGWEDIDMGYRLFQKGVPLYYLKKAINYHYHVITKQEDIDRHTLKGESAKILLKKHPELKWFLGLNPLSVFMFKVLYPEGRFHKLMKTLFSKHSVGHGFAYWFLREYNYLKGILGKS